MRTGRRVSTVIMIGVLTAFVAGCGGKEEADVEKSSIIEPIESSTESGTVPEGMYLSELTGEPIDESLKDQRPVAIMVDNEKIALPHYGVAEADIVYEMMNSTLNDRITRLMCLYKDWGKIEMVGSIRSTRPTNILLMAEYNAVLCHDGGPFYIDHYFKNSWAEHLSGGFHRENNGKDTEFTEYIISGELEKRIPEAGFQTTYNDYAPKQDTHFQFVDYGSKVDMNAFKTATAATDISLPFRHNKSELHYNPDTKTYDYYEYGAVHKDAEDNEPLTFTNVFLQDCSFSQLDKNGYLIYNCIDAGKKGYYITEGKAVAVTWIKKSETDITRFYDENGDEIKINAGKTYVGLVPDDTWSQVSLTDE